MARIINSPQTHEGFSSRLASKGWSRIGNGAFGDALAKGGLVWKVERPIYGHNSGWAKYIMAVAEGVLRGPHVPKVRLVIKLVGGGVAALMERLAETVHGFGERAKKRYLENTVGTVLRRSSRQLQSLSLGGNGWSYTPDSKKAPPTVMARFLRSMGIPTTFLGFSKTLRDWVNANDCFYDTHGHNIMLRANGTLVVTDPVT